jgi:transcriptional regulator with XRE-family HTH domain
MMIIRKLRLQRGWSQEQLAQISGLSIRTVQRIERGQKPSLESVKSLAAIFETTVAELQQEPSMSNEINITEEEQNAIDQVREIKGFYSHLSTYVMVMALLSIINYVSNPEYIWVFWPAMGWGISIIKHALHAFEVFNFFGLKWEQRKIEKRLSRK